MVHDYRTLETARKDAMDIIHLEDFWTNPEYQSLKTFLEHSGIMDGEKLD